MTEAFAGLALKWQFLPSRADEKRKAADLLEAQLTEGLNSAESDLTSADWKALREEALAKVQARRLAR